MKTRLKAVIAALIVVCLGVAGCRAGAVRERIAVDSGQADSYFYNGYAAVFYSDNHSTETHNIDSDSGVVFVAPTAATTATPAVLINVKSGGEALEVQAAGTRVYAISKTGGVAVDGAGGLDVDTTGAISLDADTASNFSVAGAGIDLTLASAAGRVVIQASEAAADAVYIDADGAAGVGLDIDVGSTGGMSVDGGCLNVGGGTPASWSAPCATRPRPGC